MLCWSCIENFGFGRALHALALNGAGGYGNFGSGRAPRALNFAGAKLACAEIERVSLPATGVADG